MSYLRLSTATTILVGPFIDDTDGKTPETALTVANINVDVYKGVSKVDLTITATGGSNDMAHVANGFYSLELTSGNTDTAGRLMVTANIAGALPVWHEFTVLAAQVYDSLVPGTDALQVHTNEITANLINAAAIADGAIEAGAIADNAINAASLATDAITEIVNGVWNALLTAYATAGSMGKALADAASPAAGGGTDLTSIGGSTTALTNFKKFFDGTGYAANASSLGSVGSVSYVGSVNSVTTLVNANLTHIGSQSDLLQMFKYILLGGVFGTVGSGDNTTTQIITNLPSNVSDNYIGKSFQVVSGLYAHSGGRIVTDYNATTRAITISPPLPGPMSVGNGFLLLG